MVQALFYLQGIDKYVFKNRVFMSLSLTNSSALQKPARFHERQRSTLAAELAASKRRGQGAHRGVHQFISLVYYAPTDTCLWWSRSKTCSPKFMETSRRVT